MGLCFSRLFQSWEVEAFHHVFASRLFLLPARPLSHPSPKASWLSQSIPLQPREAGHGSLRSLPVPACQPAHVPPCPMGQAVLSCSTPAFPAPGQGLFTILGWVFFPFFFFERAHIKAESPSFPFCHLLWVESSLTGVGNSNNKKQAPSFNVVYLSRWCRQQTGFQECAKDLDSS